MAEEKRKKTEPTAPWLKPRKRLPPPWLSPMAQTAFQDQRTIEQEIRMIISTEDVKLVDIMAYYNFGRQVARLTQKWGPRPSLNQDLAGLLKKWSAQGGKEHILVRILNELFKLDYPTTKQAPKS